MALPVILAALAKIGLPLITSAIMTKGKEYVEEKLGVDITSLVGTEEGKMKLKQLELEHEQFLVMAAQETQKLNMQELSIYAGDTANAREREMQVVASENAPGLNKIITPVLALGIMLLTISIFAVLMFGNSEVEGGRKDVIIYILGVLSAICTQVVQYYFGSSKGSAVKDETIALMNRSM